MASEARWQTSTEAEGGDTLCEDLPMVHPVNRSSSHVFDQPLDQPMDPRAAKNLLRRLVERFEDSERRYGLALEELHSRLDHLSQTTDAARDTSAPSDVDTFERLHTQVSDLARRLEGEASTPLDNFERLGKALAGGIRGDLEAGAPAPFSTAPEPSPFAQSVLVSEAHSRFAPEPELPDDYDDVALAPSYRAPTPSSGMFGGAYDFDTRLMEMADRLEQSIAAAIPTGTIEALNVRLEDIGSQIAQAVDAGLGRAALEQVESQISDMGQHLSRAEAQLGRIDGVEEHLLNLIARLDEKDAAPAPAEINTAQLQEIAATAAVDAARLVADDTKKTTERLDAIQRELTTMGDNSGESGDRLVSTLEAMHESLKQLVRQVENSQTTGSRTPFAAPENARNETPGAPSPLKLDQAVPWANASKPEKLETSETLASGTRTPRLPEIHPAPETLGAETLGAETPGAETPGAETGMTETSRERLRVRVLGLGEAEPARAPSPIKPSETGEDAIDDGLPNAAPDDLVAAARHAAQAAAARAEKRAGRQSAQTSSESAANEQPATRRRPLLIISATVLLAISALLLYGRLGTKVELEPTPEAGETVAPAAAVGDDQAPATPKTSTPAPAAVPNGVPDAGSAPNNGTKTGTENGAKDGSTGDAPSGVTDTARSSKRPMPGRELRQEPQLASLKPPRAAALPAGVVFTIEDPSSAANTARVETLPAGTAQASPLVTRAQELLNTLGYDVGAPDGLIGERTSSGVRQFQQRNGLEETGDVTIPLVRMLERRAS